jgi:hypothetical protein
MFMKKIEYYQFLTKDNKTKLQVFFYYFFLKFIFLNFFWYFEFFYFFFQNFLYFFQIFFFFYIFQANKNGLKKNIQENKIKRLINATENLINSMETLEKQVHLFYFYFHVYNFQKLY